MPVRIIPVGVLRLGAPGEDITLEAAGRTVEEVLRTLELRADLVAMVLVNGRQSPKDTVLEDGDTVKLVPFVGGG